MISTTSPSRTAPQAAVTTIFTPPHFCGGYVDDSSWLTGPSSLSSCLPGFTLGAGWYDEAYFSPAICPSGYTVDCTRWDDDQGPSLIPGETAVICCPSSFKCVGYEPFGCGSGRKSTFTRALSVQIRWQSSDLSLFQTPPLIALPTTSRHSGWDPESSLTYPYTFPLDCSTITDLWFPFDKKSCEPLTGGYYSPAICPSGWTAAATRGVLGFGPPVEADETAMLCCPSGLTMLDPVCGSSCVSATMTSRTSRTSGLSVELLEVRQPIQIRWASSDLAILETHPLTPGLFLNYPTATINPVVPPNALYKVGLGLAFAPLVVACSFATTFGILSLFWRSYLEKKQGAQTILSSPRRFRPKIFSWCPFLLLIAFIFSAIILLELSCHILPQADSEIKLRDFAITKTYLSDTVIVQREEANATSAIPLDLTCGVTGSFRITEIHTKDRGTSTTVTETFGTTTCRSSGFPVAVTSSCQRPPGAPPGADWLSAASQGGNSTIKLEGSVEGAFFLANMLPTLIASIFSIPWKLMHLHATSLEPFHQMTLSNGRTASKTLFGNYGGLRSMRSPITLVTTCLVYFSAAITALSSEAWGLSLVGTCTTKENKGCVPIIHVASKVVHSMQAVLVLIAVLAVTLAVVTWRWSTGVFADPRSILGVATLAQSSRLQNILSSFDLKSPKKDMIRKIGTARFILSTDVTDPTQPEHGILPLGQGQVSMRKDEPIATQTPQLNSGTPGKISIARVVILLSAFAVFLSALIAIAVYYTVTDESTGFERFMSSQSFGPRFLFTICGILVNFGWAAVLKVVLQLAPYYSMSSQPSRGARASTSIVQPFSIDQYSGLIYSLRGGSPYLLAATLPTILSDFLPLLLANIPFRRTTTWKAHIISSWTAVGVLSFMLLALVALLGVLIMVRPKHFLNVKLLRDAPIAATLLVLCHSEEFMLQLRNISTMETSERDEHVREMAQRYRLVWNGTDEGRDCPGIQSIDASEEIM